MSTFLQLVGLILFVAAASMVAPALGVFAASLVLLVLSAALDRA